MILPLVLRSMGRCGVRDVCLWLFAGYPLVGGFRRGVVCSSSLDCFVFVDCGGRRVVMFYFGRFV